MVNELRKVKDVWNKCQFILTKQQKKIGILVFGMTLLGAVVEMLGVSVIIPFVQIMILPEQLMENRYFAPVLEWFHITSSGQVIVLLGIAIALVYVIKNAYLVLLSYCRIRYSTKVQRELSILTMESYMKRGYLFFTQANVGDLQRGIIDDVEGVYQIIFHFFRMATELLATAAIVIFIIFTDWLMALCVIVVALLCVLIIFFGFRRPMQELGSKFWESNGEMKKYSLQAFQGSKEILAMNRQSFFINRYREELERRQKAQIGQTVAVESPAYVIEAVCVAGLILAVSMRLYFGMDAISFIPKLASFAIGAFRILPSLGRVTSSFTQFVYFVPALNCAYENLKEVRQLEQERKEEEETVNASGMAACGKQYEGEGDAYLTIENLHWKYPGAEKEVLNGIDIRIEKGSSVAIIGHSGAGKTTLADVILGLYRPRQGCVRLEGKDIRTMPDAWCRYVGYIPQMVYLMDDTIRNNVAFGVAGPDDDDVWKALEQAQLKDFVEGLPDGLDTIVGDRGIRFSGGQRQRVAIARALYYNPPILVLDEATSALDTETETAVVNAINALQGEKTLIIVAHRLTTIENCDVIYEITEGKAVKREKRDILQPSV